MSKFIDKLNRLTRAETSSLGFMREQSARPGRKIQLVASLPEESAGDVTGADAVLIGISGKGTDGESLPEIPGDIPWGGWLHGEQKKLKRLTETGCDFVVFPAGTPLATVEDTGLGRILEIDPEIGDSLLRAVNELPVDAVLVSGKPGEGSLTWQDLMLCQRIASFLNKPLLACTKTTVTGSELEALWGAGVNAVVVEAKTKDGVSKIRKIIDKTEFASMRKREKVEPVLKQPESN
jgi:hypothetical protein